MALRIHLSIAGAVLAILNNTVRKSRLLTRLLFDVSVLGSERIHWDFTTLSLRGCLQRYAHPGHRVLEVGTGPYALLSLFLAKRRGCETAACDINTAYVRSARSSAIRNNVHSLNVFESDLLESVSGRFDLIYFNAVYIPRPVGISLGINHLHSYETDWCGGETGGEVIERFLRQAPACLRPGGIVLLGYNPRYLGTKQVMSLAGESGLRPLDVWKSRIIPSKVLVLTTEQS